MVQVGGAGGLLEQPLRHDMLDLAPAERFDVVVDFSRYRQGTSVWLVNRLGSGTTSEVMRFDVASGPVSDGSTAPDPLGTVERLNPDAAVATRAFLFQ
ncbi:hypothetical protein ACWGKU_33640 [Kitasatospora sp. NPDC054768]